MTSPSDADERFMQAALRLACQGEGFVEPNPMVGCVIVRDDEIIGRGFHERFGGPHAEIAALQSLTSDARGATAYVTLEPCCHQGKTPPCTGALIDAGVQRVVVAVQDPFAKVNGGGLKQLADAGIDTTVGVLADQVSELLSPYLKVVRTSKPWVIAKWAMTVDGRIATTAGESQWITNEQSREQVHQLRSRVDAIIVGMGTVTADDPMLTARLPSQGEPQRIANRVVFCRHRLPELNSKLVQSAKQTPVMLIVNQEITKSEFEPLVDVGVQVVRVKANDNAAMVEAALEHFGTLGMTNVMLEGGGTLIGSFLEADQVDECHVYVGSKLFGGSEAPGPIAGIGISRLVDAPELRLQRVDSMGDDVRMIFRRV